MKLLKRWGFNPWVPGLLLLLLAATSWPVTWLWNPNNTRYTGWNVFDADSLITINDSGQNRAWLDSLDLWGFSGTGNIVRASVVSALGSLSSQDSNAVKISGGRIHNTAIGLPDSSASTPCNSTLDFRTLMRTPSGKPAWCDSVSGKWKVLTYDYDGDGLSTAIDDDDTTPFSTPTAVADSVIQGRTFRSGPSLTPYTGTMVNRGAKVQYPGVSDTALAAGYYPASAKVPGDADWVAGNIKAGVNLWNLVGTFPSDGTAAVADVRKGITFYAANATKLTGTADSLGTAVAADVKKGKTARNSASWNSTITGTADSTGTAVAGDVKSGATFRNSSSFSSLVTGTLSPVGTAAVGNVLSGYTFLNSSGWTTQTGTMTNQGANGFTPSTASQSIPAGYYNGAGSVLSLGGNATAAQVLSGVLFSSDATSRNASGTMTNVGAQNITPAAAGNTITQGYHNGSGGVPADADFVSTNIRAGVDIWGVAGDANVVNTSSGDATAAQILSGKKAWVDGAEVTGSMTNNGAVAYYPSSADQNIANGYHSGSTIGKVGRPFFVATTSTYDGNLGGVSGACAKCLTELTNYDFKGKATAVVNSNTVKAFIGYSGGSTWGDAKGSSTYFLAYANVTALGGQMWAADSLGYGPNDAVAWNTNPGGFNTTNFHFWTGHGATSSTKWGHGAISDNCTGWTSNSSGVNGEYGDTDHTNEGRWNHGTYACNTALQMLCFVNPY